MNPAPKDVEQALSLPCQRLELGLSAELGLSDELGLFEELGRSDVRVGYRGLRPGTLPHHRTYGFPYPAVGPGGLPACREIRWHHESVTL